MTLRHTPSPSTVPTQVVALGYARPGTARPGRPWTIIVLGIIGLVIGSLGLAVGFNMRQDVQKLHAMALAATNASPPPPLAPSTLPPYDGQVIGPRGLRRAERDKVLEVLDRCGRVNADRRLLIEWLLADIGADVIALPLSARADASASFDGTIRDVRFTTDAMTGTPAIQSQSVTTAGGRITVTNRTASFVANDGRTASVHWHNFMDYSGGVHWCSAAIERSLNAAQEAGPQQEGPGALGEPGPPAPITSVQAASLVAECRKSSSTAAEANAWNDWPFANYRSLKGGTISVRMGSTIVWVLANGAACHPVTNIPWDPVTGTAIWSPPISLNWLPTSRILTGYVVADHYFGMLLSSMLAVFSYCLLKETRLSRRMMLWYAVVKVPTAIAGAFVAASIISDLAEANRVRHLVAARGYSPDWLYFLTFVGLIVQTVFPITLLVLLNRQDIAEYFYALGEPPPALRYARSAAQLSLGGRTLRGLLYVAISLATLSVVGQAGLFIEATMEASAAATSLAVAGIVVALLTIAFVRRNFARTTQSKETPA